MVSSFSLRICIVGLFFSVFGNTSELRATVIGSSINGCSARGVIDGERNTTFSSPVLTGPETITYSCSRTADKFDPSLGTLISVQFFVNNASLTHQVTIGNSTNEIQSADVGVTLSWGIKSNGLTVPSLIVVESADISNSISASIDVNPTDDGKTVGQDGLAAKRPTLIDDSTTDPIIFNFSGEDVLPFIGSDTFDMEFFAVANISFEASDPGVSFIYTLQQRQIPSYFVDYTFEAFSAPNPDNIPEPTTLALFGIGLVGLASMRRRRMKCLSRVN